MVSLSNHGRPRCCSIFMAHLRQDLFLARLRQGLLLAGLWQGLLLARLRQDLFLARLRQAGRSPFDKLRLRRMDYRTRLMVSLSNHRRPSTRNHKGRKHADGMTHRRRPEFSRDLFDARTSMSSKAFHIVHEHAWVPAFAGMTLGMVLDSGTNGDVRAAQFCGLVSGAAFTKSRATCHSSWLSR